jgi:hypothetical protein
LSGDVLADAGFLCIKATMLWETIKETFIPTLKPQKEVPWFLPVGMHVKYYDKYDTLFSVLFQAETRVKYDPKEMTLRARFIDIPAAVQNGNCHF